MGFCAVCAQAIFLREMMPLFTGTELVLGVLLAGWLFWVGLGGLLGGRFIGSKAHRDITMFVRLTFLVALLVPATTIVIRFGRGHIVAHPGELPPFLPALTFSVCSMAPFGFIYGNLYNVASRLWKEMPMGLKGGVSRVYIWEAAGSLAGALFFSFII
ncbi:MAG: hypothetical protein KAX38_08935, partial [Candidatus Krumholzibacteria bacterium]|nr:hypothetical protein [Candidatus Krumholzibacteria bacterium]